MNSVHEQCLFSDSETVLSQNWPRAPCAQPQLSLRAQAACAWPCRGQPSALSWSRPWPCRSPRSAVSQALVAVSWPQAPFRERAGALSQRVVPCAWLPCPRLAVLYCDTVQSHSLASCHNTPRCIATQSPAKPPLPQSRYRICIVTQLLPQPTSAPVTIQPTVS